MTQDEIKSTIMDKYPNLTEKQYNLIVHDFWNAIRYYLVNPTEARGGIILHNLLSIDLSNQRLNGFLRKTKEQAESGIEYKFTKKEPEFYINLIEQKRKYARQTSKSNKHEQPVAEIPGGNESTGSTEES